MLWSKLRKELREMFVNLLMQFPKKKTTYHFKSISMVVNGEMLPKNTSHSVVKIAFDDVLMVKNRMKRLAHYKIFA